MEDLYVSIGHRIRELRIQKHMTQATLSELAGISLSFLGHIERGTRKLSVETLYKLAQAFECSADALLGTGREAELNLPLLLSIAAKKLAEQEEPIQRGAS